MIRINFKHADPEAYWITPEVMILLVIKSHIDLGFDDSSFFGLSRETIENIYDRYKEEYRTEGKARGKNLLELFRNGWIRVRKYLRPDRWSINFFSISEQSVKNLRYFASVMIKNGKPMNDEVLIDTQEYRKIYTMNELREIVC